MYSAVKVNGQRLYDLARKGVEVERKARPIAVHEAELLAFDEQTQQGRIRFRAPRARMCARSCMTLA